jgi:hypothetical protein
MNRSRRMAALMMFGAVATFVIIVAATTQPVLARSCQQECDAERAAGLQDCDDNYPGVQECRDQVNSYWYTCSTGAMTCTETWYECWAVWGANCTGNPDGSYTCSPASVSCNCYGSGC